MLTITDNAAKVVKDIAAGSGLEPDPGLRISAGSPTADGTPVELTIAPEAETTDQTVEEAGARVYVDEVLAPALDDKVLDADVHGDHVHFAIRDASSGDMNGRAPGA